MVKASAVLLLSLATAGCAMAPQASLAPDPAFKPAHYAWDGAGQNPNQPRSTARTTHTAARPESDGTDADQDARVNRSLVICQGCLPAKPQAEDSRLAKAAD